MTNDSTELVSILSSDSATIDRRLNSDSSFALNSQQQQRSTIHSYDHSSLPSNTQLFPRLSISSNNIGDTILCPNRTAHYPATGLDEYPNVQITTYLLEQLQNTDSATIQTNASHLFSTNLTTFVPQSQLLHIDKDKSSSNDPYAIVEPLPKENSPKITLLKNSLNPSIVPDQSLHYAELLIPSDLNNEYLDNNEQTQINNLSDRVHEINNFDEQERENNERLSTKIYADIDFDQTQRYDRIVQSSTKTKLDDQAPPFVL